jgi:16S rRNA (cytosine1402-N4)-methyltransferase
MVLVRSAGGINTTRQLAELVAGTIPRRAWPPKVHPATRTFQALRIAVNDELGALTEALGAMLGMLKPGGRAVVMSYHSLEDRIVKETFKDWAKGCRCPKSLPVCVCGGVARLKVLTGRPVTAQESEVEANPSARSAKLRAAERI